MGTNDNFIMEMDYRNTYIHRMNDGFNLRNLDLNLLVVFDTVFRERHVTRAAHKLGMSQPAVSNALQRLRDALKDDLLFKTTAGMEATERAEALAGPIHSIVKELEDILVTRRFDPATASGAVTLATVDYFSVVMLPLLVRLLSEKAPNLTLRIIPTNGQSFALLDRGDADLALASFGSIPSRFQKQALRRESYACVLRHDHPVLEKGLTPKRYAGLRHIIHSPGGDLVGSTDKALSALGLERHIALTISSFIHAEPILTSTEMILTAPASVAKQLSRNPGLKIIDCPVEVEGSAQQLDLMWHSRLGKRPLVDWLKTEIINLASEL